MSDKSSSKVVAWQRTRVAAVICPCLFGVPSTFRAWRGGIGHDGRRRRSTRDGSIKFLVAPQSMRVVVATVLAPYFRQIGNRIAQSDWFATSTEAMTKEGDITVPSCSKKTLLLSHQLLQQVGEVGVTHQVSFLSLPILSHIFLSLTQWAWCQVCS